MSEQSQKILDELLIINGLRRESRRAWKELLSKLEQSYSDELEVYDNYVNLLTEAYKNSVNED